MSPFEAGDCTLSELRAWAKAHERKRAADALMLLLCVNAGQAGGEHAERMANQLRKIAHE